jgi:peptidoglycan/xylan/chitin deacetylase (PgdA/CDA1 family)
VVGGVRATVKEGLRQSVAAIAPALWRLSRRPRLLILMYHRVLPLDDPARQFEQPGMIVAPETLEMHIQTLRRYFELVHLDNWVRDSMKGRALPQLACALTFDDGWRDNHAHAFPVLKAAGAPATIYLVSNLIGGSYGFWPTRLARILCNAWIAGDEGAPSRLSALCSKVAVPTHAARSAVRATADTVVTALKREYDDAHMQRAVSELQPEDGERELLTWSEVREMADSGLVRLGSHSCTHTRLTPGLDHGLMYQEVNQSAIDLEASLGTPIAGFCYPNGDHTSRAVELVGHRYQYAVTTNSGWNTVATNRALLRRIGVHDDVSDTPRRLIARVAAGL